MKKVISTWFYSSPEGENFHYPSMGLYSGSEAFQLAYFRCVISFFASSYVKNYDHLIDGKFKHIFLCNRLPDFVGKINFMDYMKKFMVEILYFEPLSIPSFSYTNNLLFGSVFSQIDVVRKISERVSDDDFIYIFDNDCLANKSLADICEIDSVHALNLHPNSLDIDVQGYALGKLLDIANEFNIDQAQPMRDYIHCGGELVAMTGKKIKIFSRFIDQIYEKNLERFESGKDYFTTEEMIFSQAYRYLESFTSTNIIKRVWTEAEKYRTVDGTELNFTFLHLPAEKGTGFSKLFAQFNNFLPFIDDENYFEKINTVFNFENYKKIFNL